MRTGSRAQRSRSGPVELDGASSNVVPGFSPSVSSTPRALVFSKIGTTEPLPNGAKPEYINGTNFKVFVPGDVPHAGYGSTTVNKQ